jgi:hypothetical protein
MLTNFYTFLQMLAHSDFYDSTLNGFLGASLSRSGVVSAMVVVVTLVLGECCLTCLVL